MVLIPTDIDIFVSCQVKEKKGILPIMRFYSYLETKGWWDAERDRALRDKERLSVLEVSLSLFVAQVEPNRVALGRRSGEMHNTRLCRINVPRRSVWARD